MPLYCRIHALVFQPTLPRGERRSSLFIVFYSKDNFNPRSREGSDHYRQILCHLRPYFNPRSREGSDVSTPFKWLCVYIISTHAPARGATVPSNISSMICLFQPTLPRGERQILKNYLLHYCLFQPTLPRGERPLRRMIIMATAKFQPTLPRGERLSATALVGTFARFQPTLPRGERRHCGFYIIPNFHFNPRSREGSDIFQNRH